MKTEMPKLVGGEIVYPPTSEIIPEIQSWIDSATAMRARIVAKYPDKNRHWFVHGKSESEKIHECYIICEAILEQRGRFLNEHAPTLWTETRLEFLCIQNGKVKPVVYDISDLV